MFDVRLLIPAVILWITGICFVLTGKNVDVDIVWVVLIAILSLTLISYILLKDARKQLSQILFCSILVTLQLFSYNLGLQYNRTDSLVGTETKDIEVIIKSTPNVQNSFGLTKCSYQVESASPRGFYTLQTGTKSGDNDCLLDYGAKYVVTGKYAEDDFHLKNTATIVAAKPLELVENANIVDNICNQIHSAFLRVAKKLVGEAPSLVPGMSIGDTRFMSKELSDATKISSLTHLTAISGSHFVIIISMIGTLLSLLKMNRKLLAFLQILSVLLLVELVHPTDSVKRAAIMSVIGLAGVWLNRRAVSLSALGCVICGWLLIDPYLACSYGFALSSAATASIILFSAPLTRKLTPYLGKTLASLLSVPIVAQAGCTPILLLMTDYISPLGVIANLLVTPVIEPATILALFACLISPLNASVSYVLASISGFFTEVVANVAYFVAGLPLAKINWQTGVIGALSASIICMLVILLPKVYKICYTTVMHRALPESTSLPMRMYSWREKHVKSMRNWQTSRDRYILSLPKKKRIRRVIIGVIFALLVGILIGALILLNPVEKIKNLIAPANIPSTWMIAACDVGQGDAGVIRIGQTHKAILVDTGPKDRETGGESINSCLSRLQIESVELLQISHYHDDHIGGLAELLTKYKPREALLPPVKSPEVNYNQVIKLLERSGVDYKFAEVGDYKSFNCSSPDSNIKANTETTWQFIKNGEEGCTKFAVASIYGLDKQTQPKASAASKSAVEDDLENNSSVNLVFNINGYKYWTAGDLEADGDKFALTALKTYNLSDIDIVKVNHHGSKTQNKTLNSLLNPKVVIFMVGKNSYGHPALDTLNSFADLGAKILRTDQDGICGLYMQKVENGNVLATFKSK